MIDDLYTHPHTSTLCKVSKPIEGRNGCKTDSECLENGRKKCEADPECLGIAWYRFREEQALKICYSREFITKPGWRTIWKKDGMFC